MPEEPDDEFLGQLDLRLNELSGLIADVVEQLLRHQDDRVTILGMVHSVVMHGLHDGGFTDETV